MNTAKFPTELEETKLINTDGFVLVSDGDGHAKKMRPSVTHTEDPQSDGTVYHYTRLLTEEGNAIVESDKDTKNDTTTYDGVTIRTAAGNDVVNAHRDRDAETGNLTNDEVSLRTADGNDVVFAHRDRDADTGNPTHDEVYLRTAEGNDVVYAQRNLDADTGNTTHDEVYLRTAEGNDVVECERTFDANGDETDKKTTLFAKSLKSLKVATDDGTFTAEQLADGTHLVDVSQAGHMDFHGGYTAAMYFDSDITVTAENLPDHDGLVSADKILFERYTIFLKNTDSTSHTVTFSLRGHNYSESTNGAKILQLLRVRYSQGAFMITL